MARPVGTARTPAQLREREEAVLRANRVFLVDRYFERIVRAVFPLIGASSVRTLGIFHKMKVRDTANNLYEVATDSTVWRVTLESGKRRTVFLTTREVMRPEEIVRYLTGAVNALQSDQEAA